MATAARLRPSLIPQCPACARRLLDIGLGGARQQVRGKKKLAKGQSSTITVKLLKDVTAFGRQGAFVPISSGQMRNKWFPSGVAEYVPQTQLRQLRLDNTSFERNHAFVSAADAARITVAAPAEEVQESTPARAPTIKVQQLSPQRAAELLEIFVPARIDFYRQAIVEPEAAPAQAHQAVSAAAAIMARAAAKARTKAPTAIYGSVSISDVTSNIAAALQENDESARVVLSESDLQFVGLPEGEDKTRVKHIGEFTVEIQLKGAPEPVRRIVRILPSEES